MKAAVVGAVVGVVLSFTAVTGWWDARPTFAQRPASTDPGELITITLPGAEHRQQLVVVDPRSRVLSVYHVDPASGEVALRSVRNIHWDLQLTEFNSTAPSPREVRALLDQH